MPRKSTIQSKWNKVATILAVRDSGGKVKCAINGCTENRKEKLIIHHRFEPFYAKGDQYKRLQTCEQNPDNCEILCKRHAETFDKALMSLEDERLGRSPFVPDKETVKLMILELRKKVEYEETHYDEYEAS